MTQLYNDLQEREVLNTIAQRLRSIEESIRAAGLVGTVTLAASKGGSGTPQLEFSVSINGVETHRKPLVHGKATNQLGDVQYDFNEHSLKMLKLFIEGRRGDWWKMAEKARAENNRRIADEHLAELRQGI